MKKENQTCTQQRVEVIKHEWPVEIRIESYQAEKTGDLELLAIRTNDNQKKYVLYHNITIYYHPRGTNHNREVLKEQHRKIELGSLEDLSKIFFQLHSYYSDFYNDVRDFYLNVLCKKWEKTDGSCGYNIPEEEFKKARRLYFDKSYNKTSET